MNWFINVHVNYFFLKKERQNNITVIYFSVTFNNFFKYSFIIYVREHKIENQKILENLINMDVLYCYVYFIQFMYRRNTKR